MRKNPGFFVLITKSRDFPHYHYNTTYLTAFILKNERTFFILFKISLALLLNLTVIC